MGMKKNVGITGTRGSIFSAHLNDKIPAQGRYTQLIINNGSGNLQHDCTMVARHRAGHGTHGFAEYHYLDGRVVLSHDVHTHPKTQKLIWAIAGMPQSREVCFVERYYDQVRNEPWLNIEFYQNGHLYLSGSADDGARLGKLKEAKILTEPFVAFVAFFERAQQIRLKIPPESTSVFERTGCGYYRSEVVRTDVTDRARAILSGPCCGLE